MRTTAWVAGSLVLALVGAGCAGEADGSSPPARSTAQEPSESAGAGAAAGVAAESAGGGGEPSAAGAAEPPATGEAGAAPASGMPEGEPQPGVETATKVRQLDLGMLLERVRAGMPIDDLRQSWIFRGEPGAEDALVTAHLTQASVADLEALASAAVDVGGEEDARACLPPVGSMPADLEALERATSCMSGFDAAVIAVWIPLPALEPFVARAIAITAVGQLTLSEVAQSNDVDA